MINITWSSNKSPNPVPPLPGPEVPALKKLSNGLFVPKNSAKVALQSNYSSMKLFMQNLWNHFQYDYLSLKAFLIPWISMESVCEVIVNICPTCSNSRITSKTTWKSMKKVSFERNLSPIFAILNSSCDYSVILGTIFLSSFSNKKQIFIIIMVFSIFQFKLPNPIQKLGK